MKRIVIFTLKQFIAPYTFLDVIWNEMEVNPPSVVMKTKLMQFQVENDLHEDVELQSEIRHALDVLIDEHEKCWNALSI